MPRYVFFHLDLVLPTCPLLSDFPWGFWRKCLLSVAF